MTRPGRQSCTQKVSDPGLTALDKWRRFEPELLEARNRPLLLLKMAASNVNRQVKPPKALDNLVRCRGVRPTSEEHVRRDSEERGEEYTGSDDGSMPLYTQRQALGSTGLAALDIHVRAGSNHAAD